MADKILEEILRNYGKELYQREQRERQEVDRQFERDKARQRQDERENGYYTYEGQDRDREVWHPPIEYNPDSEDGND